MRKILTIACYLISFSVAAQSKKVLYHLESTVGENSLLAGEFSSAAFLKQADLKSEFDPTDPDQDKLNALLFASINSYRAKRSRKELKYSAELYKVCEAYIKGLTKNFFTQNTGNTIKINKPLKDASALMGYKKGILSAYVFRVPLIDHPEFKSFYFDKEGETTLQLFKGVPPTVQEIKGGTAETPVPLKLFTYLQFSNSVMKTVLIRKMAKDLKSKSFTELACFLVVDPKTLGKKALPQGNLVIAFSGPRLGKVMSVKPPREIPVRDSVVVRN